jgi:hypothetical protein
MLRHMLFPVWVQSVEKYADRQPQELLVKVAAGNAPANFVFCLNKVDQVDGNWPSNSNPIPDSGSPIRELQSDYAERLRRVLALDAAPKVWPIAAIYPDRYELPALRDLLAQQKSEDAVRDSLAKAALRQKSSVLHWLDRQDLPARAQRLGRLEEQAREIINDRLGGPLLENVLEKLIDDPLHRQAIIDDCLARRVARWPILSVLHPLYSAVAGFFRRNAEATPRPLLGNAAEALVDAHVRGALGTAGRSLGDTIQATFALLQQSSPLFSEMYADRKLWDAMPASVAAGELRDRLIATVDRQRKAACEKLNPPGGTLSSLARGLLTIGALIWFPFAQPIVRALLARHTHAAGANDNNLPLLFVDLFSVNNVLGSLTFLLIYFTILWLVLRWEVQRRVNRQFSRWKRLENIEPDLSLAARVIDWLDGLIEPVHARRAEFDELSTRVEQLRKSIT